MTTAASDGGLARWGRYVALGDSFTEGLNDPDPARSGAHRGWADRLAQHLAVARDAAGLGPVEYANLAVRGRLLRQVLEEQVPVALAARPRLVSIVAGGNDLLRPGSDPDGLARDLERAVAAFRRQGTDVLLATGVDPGGSPVIRRTRPRVATFNAHLWSLAQRHGAVVLDQWGARWLLDWRLWDGDRIHLNAEGHRRTALAAAVALGVPVPEADGTWREPLPPLPPRALRTAVAEEAAWVRGFVVPWVLRRVRGRSSGDGRSAKRPEPVPLDLA